MTYQQTIAISYTEKPQFDLVLDDIKDAVADKIEILTAEAIDAYVQESLATLQPTLITQIETQQTTIEAQAALILELQQAFIGMTTPP